MAWVLDGASIGERSKVQESEINAHGFKREMVDDILLHLTGKHNEPVLSFSFNCTGFHRALRWVSFLACGHFYLDRADFGETYPVILSERKTRLWIRERVIAPIALKTRVSWRFPLFDAPEKGFECFVHAPQNILQNLGMNVVVL